MSQKIKVSLTHDKRSFIQKSSDNRLYRRYLVFVLLNCTTMHYKELVNISLFKSPVQPKPVLMTCI